METGITDNDLLPPAGLRESEVAELTGVSPAALKKAREERLVEDVDWERRGRAVVYLPGALEKIRPGAAGELQPLPEADLVVSRTVRNPRLVLALEPDGTEVRVRVRNGALYCPRMTLKNCKRVAPGLYLFQGQPPRRRGHW